MVELTVVDCDAPALVDDSLAYLVKYRWRLDRCGYVYRKVHGVRLYLHYTVLPGQRYPQFVRDHINRDKLDNRSCNLRWLTHTESAQNRGPYARKHRLGLRGVSPLPGGKFLAGVSRGGKLIRRGVFDCPQAAAAAASSWRREVFPLSFEG